MSEDMMNAETVGAEDVSAGAASGSAGHEGRDHSSHSHAGHDHSGHDHAGHDHSSHSHAGHSHAPVESSDFVRTGGDFAVSPAADDASGSLAEAGTWSMPEAATPATPDVAQSAVTSAIAAQGGSGESGTPSSRVSEIGIVESAATPAGLATVADVEEAMRDVVDPELGINVVDLGLVYGVAIDQNHYATIDMTLTSAACPLTDMIEEQVQMALDGVVAGHRINWVWLPPWGAEKITDDGRQQLRALGFNV